MYCIALYCIVVYCSVLYFIVIKCELSHCIVLYCIKRRVIDTIDRGDHLAMEYKATDDR